MGKVDEVIAYEKEKSASQYEKAPTDDINVSIQQSSAPTENSEVLRKLE